MAASSNLNGLLRRLQKYGSEHKTELLLFGVAFGIRIAYAIFVQLYAGSQGFIAFSDAKAFYYREAMNLVAGHGFSIAAGEPFYANAYHTPLYPLFVAFFYALKLPTFFVIAAQCALAGGIVVFFYRIAEKITNSKKIALWSGVLAALEPMSVYWCALLMSDTLFSFLLVASFYYLLEKKYVSTAIFLGLATLARPIGLYLLPAYIVFVAFEAYKSGGAWRAVAKKAAVVVVIFAAVISPWYARNKIVFDTWSLSSAGWYNLYATALAQYTSERGLSLPTIPIYTEDPDSFRRFSFAYTPFFHDTVTSFIAEDPAGFAVFEVKRSWSSFFASKYWYLWHYVVSVKFPALANAVPELAARSVVWFGDIAWIGIYLAACLALAKRDLWPVWLFAAAVVGINAVLSGIIDPVGPQMTRYSIPFFGFYFAFAGVGILWIRNKIKTSA